LLRKTRGISEKTGSTLPFQWLGRRIGARHHAKFRRPKLTAAFFVATVGAVRGAGTMQEPGNARVVPATELVGPARAVVAPVRRFVGSVGAVHAAVAHPRLYHAVAVVVALELGRTTLRHSGRLQAALLVKL